MKLLALTLQNFKGIKDITITANGQNILIFGENGAGKTTIFDAFLWLLFSKDSSGRANFKLKTLTPDGQPIEKIEHSVEATFEHDENEFTLKRVLSEKWSKPRGQADHVYGGDETSFYINDVPKKKGEYEAYISSMVSEELFRMITNPMHFNSLDWKKRREIMLELVPGVDDEAVIATDPTLAPVRELLKGVTTDEALARLKSQRKKLNDDIDTIPVRIDEINKGLEVQVESVDIDSVNASKEALEHQKKSLLDRINNAVKAASNSKNLVYSQINNVTAQLNKNKEIRREAEQERASLHEGLNRFAVRIQQAQDSIEDIEKRIVCLADDLANKQAEKSDLLAEYRNVEKQDVNPPVSDSCPTCGQSLPADQLQQKQAEVKQNLTDKKARELQHIKDKGSKANDEIKRLQSRMEELEKYKADQVAVIEKAQADVESEKTTIDKPLPDFTKQNAMLEEQLKALREKAEQPCEAVDTSELENELLSIDEELAKLNRIIANQDVYAKAQARIDELRVNESRMGASLVKTDGQIALVERFIVAKVNLVEGQLNDIFKNVSFKLFERQVNGGISETFVTLINGVPYPDANTAAQINSGLEIIEHLCQHYGFRAPVFIDHQESVTKLVPIGSQTIGLEVSKDHKNLTVEVAS